MNQQLLEEKIDDLVAQYGVQRTRRMLTAVGVVTTALTLMVVVGLMLTIGGPAGWIGLAVAAWAVLTLPPGLRIIDSTLDRHGDR